MEYAIAAFIGLFLAVPILIPRLQTFLRHHKHLRLAVLICLPLFVLVFLMFLDISVGYGVGFFYFCMERNANRSEETIHYSYCDDNSVHAQYTRESQIQHMLPPNFRKEEICWTVEAGSFCNSLAFSKAWEHYLYILSVGATGASLCAILLWAFTRDERKRKAKEN